MSVRVVGRRPGGAAAYDVVVREVAVALPVPASTSVVAVETVESPVGIDAWATQEIELPARLDAAHPARLSTYLAGRHCAGESLRRAGSAGDVGAGDRDGRAPLWPDGFAGSIAHTTGFAIAAAAPSPDGTVAIGIDCERMMTDAVAATVGERVHAGGARRAVPRGLTDGEWTTLVFSAKESLYKALHPHVGVFFGFADADVGDVDVSDGRLALTLVRDLATGWHTGTALEARFARAGAVWCTIVCTTIAARRGAPGATRGYGPTTIVETLSAGSSTRSGAPGVIGGSG